MIVMLYLEHILFCSIWTLSTLKAWSLEGWGGKENKTISITYRPPIVLGRANVERHKTSVRRKSVDAELDGPAYKESDLGESEGND